MFKELLKLLKPEKQVEPANLIVECKACYLLKNGKGEFIGYIFER